MSASDELERITRELVSDFDAWPRPLLPNVRAAFGLSVADALTVIRTAALVAERHSKIEILDDDDE